MNKEIMELIERLKQYKEQGEMGIYEIDETIARLQQIYSLDGQQRMNKLMDDVTLYLTQALDEKSLVRKYVKEHMEQVASYLGRSQRTIYRKLQNDSFTLVEMRMIQKRMLEND